MHTLLTFVARAGPDTATAGRFARWLPLVAALVLVLAYGPGDFDPEMGFTYPPQVLAPFFLGLALWVILMWRGRR